jgi:hypothetical protein
MLVQGPESPRSTAMVLGLTFLYFVGVSVEVSFNCPSICLEAFGGPLCIQSHQLRSFAWLSIPHCTL